MYVMKHITGEGMIYPMMNMMYVMKPIIGEGMMYPMTNMISFMISFMMNIYGERKDVKQYSD